jgi:acyl carrier protein
MEKTIQEKVIDTIVEQLGANRDNVKLDSSFIEDLGADSLDSVELVMAFEEEFGLQISDDEAEDMKTVQDAVNYIQKHVTD